MGVSWLIFLELEPAEGYFLWGWCLGCMRGDRCLRASSPSFLLLVSVPFPTLLDQDQEEQWEPSEYPGGLLCRSNPWHVEGTRGDGSVVGSS